MEGDDDVDNLVILWAAAMKALAEFNDMLDSYREAAPTPEQAAGLIVDQQAAADRCVAVFQASVRRRLRSSPSPE